VSYTYFLAYVGAFFAIGFVTALLMIYVVSRNRILVRSIVNQLSNSDKARLISKVPLKGSNG